MGRRIRRRTIRSVPMIGNGRGVTSAVVVDRKRNTVMMYHIALDIYADVGFIAGSHTTESKVVSDKAWYEVVEAEVIKAKAANPTASSVTLRWVKEYEDA
jgi:hypothetical protein